MLPGGSRTAFERRDACTTRLRSERRGSGQECTRPSRPAPQPWVRAPHLQASWGDAAPRCPMQSSSRSRGSKSLRLQEGPPPQDYTGPPAQAFSIQQKWLRRASPRQPRGRFPRGRGGAAMVLACAGARTGDNCKNRGMVPPASALLAVGPLVAVGPRWLR